MAEEVTIYDKYGGHDFFHGCIYGLYLDMFDHPEIAYHFMGVDLVKLSKLQTQYLIRAIGGPSLYEGRPIAEVHKDMDITFFQFDEIARSFRDVFLDKGVSAKDADIIMNFVAGHEKAIVTQKSSWIDEVMRPIYQFIKRNFGKFLPRKNSWVLSTRIKRRKK